MVSWLPKQRLFLIHPVLKRWGFSPKIDNITANSEKTLTPILQPIRPEEYPFDTLRKDSCMPFPEKGLRQWWPALPKQVLASHQIYAGLAYRERRHVLEAFQCDDLKIVVATVVFGIGLRFPTRPRLCVVNRQDNVQVLLRILPIRVYNRCA